MAVLQVTPATPTPSSPRAAIVPETWVPCPLPSSGCASPSTKSQPWTSSMQPVAVVVEAVGVAAGARLARVRPQVGGEVRVRRVDPGVDHGHRHLRGPGRDVPRLGRADGAHVPLVGEQRVVRHRGLADHVIGLGVDHAVQTLEVSDGGADADAGLGVDELEAAYGERGVALDVRRRAHVGALLRRRVGGEANDHAGDRRRAWSRRATGLGRTRARARGQRQQEHGERRDDPCRQAGHPARMMARKRCRRTSLAADGADTPPNGRSITRRRRSPGAAAGRGPSPAS